MTAQQLNAAPHPTPEAPQSHTPNIPFIDLAAQQARLKPQLDAAIANVLAHGKYIMGPEVKELEAQLSAFCGAKYAISCSSGTDALALYLMAKGVKPGDAILVPSFTFAATAEVVAWLGAVPVFVDVDPATFNICPNSLKTGLSVAKDQGLNAVGIITVDLFGLPADYDTLHALAAENGLWILDDAAQGFGGSYKGTRIGTLAEATATSFFPAKPLGCYGDGGAVFTDNEDIAKGMQSVRVHGKGDHKYDNARIGMNARLDTLQAAILIEKLAIFEAEIEARNKAATYYTNALQNIAETPFIPENLTSAWAQYTLKVDPASRGEIQAALKEKGVPTMVYYPLPLHQQTAYKAYPTAGALTTCETLSQSVMSLPMHPYLNTETQDYIVDALTQVL